MARTKIFCDKEPPLFGRKNIKKRPNDQQKHLIKKDPPILVKNKGIVDVLNCSCVVVVLNIFMRSRVVVALNPPSEVARIRFVGTLPFMIKWCPIPERSCLGTTRIHVDRLTKSVHGLSKAISLRFIILGSNGLISVAGHGYNDIRN